MKHRFTTQLYEMNFEQIHAVLNDSYWCRGIPKPILERALQNSLCFGLVDQGMQLGFGRFVTDYATYAYLADVFVVESVRGQGLGKLMMAQAMALPEVQGLRRMMLATRDAHSLYEKVGFTPLPAEQVEFFMQFWQPDVYA